MVGNGGLFRNKSRTEFWVVLQFGKILFWIWIFIEVICIKGYHVKGRMLSYVNCGSWHYLSGELKK